MEEYFVDSVEIRHKETKGLFVKRHVYEGALIASPGIRGYSTNKHLEKIYHRGDVVTAKIKIQVDKNNDEYMLFEITDGQEVQVVQEA